MNFHSTRPYEHVTVYSCVCMLTVCTCLQCTCMYAQGSKLRPIQSHFPTTFLSLATKSFTVVATLQLDFVSHSKRIKRNFLANFELNNYRNEKPSVMHLALERICKTGKIAPKLPSNAKKRITLFAQSSAIAAVNLSIWIAGAHLFMKPLDLEHVNSSGHSSVSKRAT